MKHSMAVVNRRDLLRVLLREAHAVAGELSGRPHLRLSQIATLADGQIAKIRPRILSGVSIIAVGGWLHAADRERPGGVRLFESTSETDFVVAAFTGEKSIEQLSDEYTARFGGSREAAFRHIKECVLELVRVGVCVPSNALEM